MLTNKRKSKQRDLILDIVKADNTHPTAEWIYGEAKKKIPTIGIATVYRNLNQLVDMGVILKISMPGQSDRYDGTTCKHYHMRCSKCGKLIDIYPVDNDSMPELKSAIAKSFGISDRKFEISETMLSYVCDDCANIENKSKA